MPIRHRPNLSTWWNTRIIRFGDAFLGVEVLGERGGVGWWYEQNGQNKECFYLTDRPSQTRPVSRRRGRSTGSCPQTPSQQLGGKKNAEEENEVLCGGLRMHWLICGSDKERETERLTDELVLALFFYVFSCACLFVCWFQLNTCLIVFLFTCTMQDYANCVWL